MRASLEKAVADFRMGLWRLLWANTQHKMKLLLLYDRTHTTRDPRITCQCLRRLRVTSDEVKCLLTNEQSLSEYSSRTHIALEEIVGLAG